MDFFLVTALMISAWTIPEFVTKFLVGDPAKLCRSTPTLFTTTAPPAPSSSTISPVPLFAPSLPPHQPASTNLSDAFWVLFAFVGFSLFGLVFFAFLASSRSLVAKITKAVDRAVADLSSSSFSSSLSWSLSSLSESVHGLVSDLSLSVHRIAMEVTSQEKSLANALAQIRTLVATVSELANHQAAFESSVRQDIALLHDRADGNDEAVTYFGGQISYLVDRVAAAADDQELLRGVVDERVSETEAEIAFLSGRIDELVATVSVVVDCLSLPGHEDRFDLLLSLIGMLFSFVGAVPSSVYQQQPQPVSTTPPPVPSSSSSPLTTHSSDLEEAFTKLRSKVSTIVEKQGQAIGRINNDYLKMWQAFAYLDPQINAKTKSVSSPDLKNPDWLQKLAKEYSGRPSLLTVARPEFESVGEIDRAGIIGGGGQVQQVEQGMQINQGPVLHASQLAMSEKPPPGGGRRGGHGGKRGGKQQ